MLEQLLEMTSFNPDMLDTGEEFIKYFYGKCRNIASSLTIAAILTHGQSVYSRRYGHIASYDVVTQSSLICHL
jgi:hypothetical protein